MPSGDRTGPEGFGPRTGRGLGFCNSYDSPGYTKGIPRGGRGFGRGRGRGFGRRVGWGRGQPYVPYPDERYYPYHYPEHPSEPYPTMTEDDEKHYLENLIKSLENELNSVKKRLDELTTKNNK